MSDIEPADSVEPEVVEPEVVKAAPAPDPVEALPPGRMTDKERQIGFVLGGVAVVGIAIPWFVEAIQKSDGTALAVGAVSLVLAVGFGVAVYSSRRLIAAVAAVLLQFTTGNRGNVTLVVGVLLLGFGAYLMLRYSNAAGKRNAELRTQRNAAKREGRPPPSGGRGRGRGSRSSAASTPPAANTPKASKRYTPPKKTTRRR